MEKSDRILKGLKREGRYNAILINTRRHHLEVYFIGVYLEGMVNEIETSMEREVTSYQYVVYVAPPDFGMELKR